MRRKTQKDIYLYGLSYQIGHPSGERDIFCTGLILNFLNLNLNFLRYKIFITLQERKARRYRDDRF